MKITEPLHEISCLKALAEKQKSAKMLHQQNTRHYDDSSYDNMVTYDNYFNFFPTSLAMF
jgi:hypothetical protein